MGAAMKGQALAWDARVELDRDAPPDAQAVFVSTDANGNPGGLKTSVLERLRVPMNVTPKRDALLKGYSVIENVPINRRLLCFIVTVGVEEVAVQTALKTNLEMCLRDERVQACTDLWIPLMGTGAGRLSADLSLKATLGALEAAGTAYQDVNVTISASPDITDSDLAHLRALVTETTGSPEGFGDDIGVAMPVDDEVAAVVAVAGELGKGRRENNSFVTTTRLLFALAESRNADAPAGVRTSVAALAFADALHAIAGARYRVAWNEYFLPNYGFHAPTDLEPHPALSNNVKSVFDTAGASARSNGRRRIAVEDLVVALSTFPAGNHQHFLSTMRIDGSTLQTEFYRRFLASIPPSTPSDLNVTFPITNDLATARDGLHHDPYARAIAGFLVHPDTTGPVSVSVQAPWGAGKSSLMRQIRAILDPGEVDRLESVAHAGDTRRAPRDEKRLTLGDVHAFLDRKASNAELKRSEADRNERWTVWFNAWKYESSEQVWAGLVDAIVTQVSDRLDPVERELFLLRLHLARIDDGIVRRRIYDRVIIFWWGSVRRWLLAAVAAIAALLGLSTMPGLALLHTPALFGAFLVQIVISAYAVTRFFMSRADVNKEPAKFSLAEYLRVPDYTKSVGVVHQIHDDLRRILRILPGRRGPLGNSIPAPLVIFIDDLDRCSPTKVAAVVEGVNMFLASDLYECMFIIGMDPQMVAAALEQAHKDVREKLPAYEKAVPLGWRFMDKFVQLPFTIPQSDSVGVATFIGTLLPQSPGDANARDPSPDGTGPLAGVRVVKREGPLLAKLWSLMSRRFAFNRTADQATVGDGRRSSIVRASNSVRAEVQEQLSRRLTDDSGPVREMMRGMGATFSSNPREIKRLLNMCRFYLFLRAGRIADGKAVPELDQYQRWIMLSLRWPDMTRWLQWSAAELPLDDGASAGRGAVEQRLRRLEDQAAKSADLVGWRTDLATQLGLVDGGNAIAWLDDDNLFTFFKRESNRDPKKRISAGAALGFY